jgi:hypothetical protein
MQIKVKDTAPNALKDAGRPTSSSTAAALQLFFSSVQNSSHSSKFESLVRDAPLERNRTSQLRAKRIRPAQGEETAASEWHCSSTCTNFLFHGTRFFYCISIFFSYTRQLTTWPLLSLEFAFCLPVPTRSIGWKVSADSESNRTAPNVLLAPTFRQTFTFYQTTAHLANC